MPSERALQRTAIRGVMSLKQLKCSDAMAVDVKVSVERVSS